MKRLGFVLFVILLAIGSYIASAPFQVYNSIHDIQLYLNDVRKKSTQNFEYFERNTCRNSSCTCVLLIHGLNDRAYTWTNLLTLSQEHWEDPMRFIAINLPGSGNTPRFKNTAQYEVRSMARKVASDFLPMCERWVVVGNSLGGWLATWMAIDYPYKVKGLVLEGAAGMDLDYSHLIQHFSNPTISSYKDIYMRSYHNHLPLPNFVFKILKERIDKLPGAEILKAVKKSSFLDLHIAKIQMPTLLLWGASDRVIPVEHGKKLKEKIKNSQLFIQKKCGHIIHKECTDFTSSKIKSFLRSVSSL